LIRLADPGPVHRRADEGDALMLALEAAEFGGHAADPRLPLAHGPGRGGGGEQARREGVEGDFLEGVGIGQDGGVGLEDFGLKVHEGAGNSLLHRRAKGGDDGLAGIDGDEVAGGGAVLAELRGIVAPLLPGFVAESGRIAYHASPLVTAMLRGGICVLDEGNRMSEKSWASLAPLLDHRRYVESIVAGITVPAHADFRCCVTMNDDASTYEVPDYILSRLQPTLCLEFPSRKDEMAIMRYHLPFAGDEILAMTVEFLQDAHGLDLDYSPDAWRRLRARPRRSRDSAPSTFSSDSRQASSWERGCPGSWERRLMAYWRMWMPSRGE